MIVPYTKVVFKASGKTMGKATGYRVRSKLLQSVILILLKIEGKLYVFALGLCTEERKRKTHKYAIICRESMYPLTCPTGN